MKSVLNKEWRLIAKNESFIIEISRKFKVSDFLAGLIASKVTSISEACSFLDPKIKKLLPDPMHLLDMEKAITRTIAAIDNNEKISIFADYDVDGCTSAALLKNILYELNVSTEIYIPDRIIEGYGPNINAIRKIKQSGTKLLIMVDCGSISFGPLEYADQIGLDIIVIDHHISLTNLPKAVAIVNPNRFDQTSECKNLAAVGITFLFIVGLCSQLKKTCFFSKKKIVYPNLMNQLDIVALGTVCDVMPLVGLNRAFVKQGLIIAQKRRNIGYSTLCDISLINGPIKCYHLGFILGPKINAGGRVGEAQLGVELLTTKCPDIAKKIACKLDQYNNARKVIEMQILDQADQIANQQISDPILYIVGDDWHPGVIGIVASRLKDKYNKPTIIISFSGKDGKASCRSVKGIDLGNKIIAAKLQSLVEKGGGHSMAAGFSLQREKVNQLHQFLIKSITKDIKNNIITSQVNFYHAELIVKSINYKLISEIEKIAPFGVSNSTPIFKFSNLYILNAKIIANKHIKVIFASKFPLYNATTLNAIAFNVVDTTLEKVLMYKKYRVMSVLAGVYYNQYNDQSKIEIHIKDIVIEDNI